MENETESKAIYQKHKLCVKRWENDFKKKHGRIPSKYDIREASKEIRYSYKMYYKLKTSFLEDTLNDILAEDGFDVLEMSQAESENGGKSNGSVPAIFSNVENLVHPHYHKGVSEFEATKELESNANAWGKNVSQKCAGESEMKEQKLTRSNLNHRLFGNSSFSKRNPRKLCSKLSTTQATISGSIPSSNDDLQYAALPDLELILLQKAKEQPEISAIIANPLLKVDTKIKAPIKRNVDEGWLNRTTQIGTATMADKLSNCSENLTRKYGLSNVDITKIVPDPQQLEKCMPVISASGIASYTKPLVEDASSDSVVSDSEEETTAEIREQSKKKRRTETLTILKEISLDPDTNVIQTEVAVNELRRNPEPHTSPKSTRAGESDAIGDLESNSILKVVAKKPNPESDNLANNLDRSPKSSKRRLPGKLKHVHDADADVGDPEEPPPNPEELRFTLALESGAILSVPRANAIELNSAQMTVHKYINTIGMPPTTTPKCSLNQGVVNEKRNAARKKMEEKIATGKLNENFHTINIQKKSFVRGKKTVNYSKYKKQLWKDKKRVSALTGPDMDMRGCDGGKLTCFSCGRNGHMASKCPIKSDALLPLTAQLEEDPSPFPTLEEAELMASQSAVVVHSADISKLPQAMNKAIVNKPVTTRVSSTNDNEETSSDEGSENHFESDEDLNNLDIDQLIREDMSRSASFATKQNEDATTTATLKELGLDAAKGGVDVVSRVSTLYDLHADGSTRDITPEVLDALHMFGHSNFRKGQDRAIMRILSGLSTLVTLSTGSGKSLCYQLPAYLYSRAKKSITLVISPLVSLMEDQVTGVPSFLRAYCLHTNQTPQQRLKILQMIGNGEVDILLVSPEAVVAGERSTGFGSILRQLPPIAFACIDEAHCVSQWSHNFRPSYLMICNVLRNNLGVSTILGLTATATLPTRMSIIEHLGILDGERGIISDIPLPENLVLSVSKDANRDAALLELLRSERFDKCDSIIIYCTRRAECERVASLLRTTMQSLKVVKGTRKRKRTNWHAEPYHAGLPASRRRTIQKAFMQNELCIVVATIAFGMGIDKPDIRSVIHYNMPRNFESYVQEIGRAGRDGKISHCHMFLNAQGNDQYELRRHIHANSIDRHVIRKLLQNIFSPCSCNANLNNDKRGSTADNFGAAPSRTCAGHEIGFSIEKTVEALDLPEENISTLLCYLQLDSRWQIHVLRSAYMMAKVISYGGPKYLKFAAKQCPPLAMAIALQIKSGKFDENANIIEFSTIDVASTIGWHSSIVKYQLKNLEWIQINGRPKRSPVNVSFFDLGFRLRAPGDFTADEIDLALDVLYDRCVKQEHNQLIQLQYAFQGLSEVAFGSCTQSNTENCIDDRSTQLKTIIRHYFCNKYPEDLQLETMGSTVTDEDLVNDIHSLVNMYPENDFNGRAIARIFHGISSPNYSAIIWSRCKYWRVRMNVDFIRIVNLANSVIVQRRIGDLT